MRSGQGCFGGPVPPFGFVKFRLLAFEDWAGPLQSSTPDAQNERHDMHSFLALELSPTFEEARLCEVCHERVNVRARLFLVHRMGVNILFAVLAENNEVSHRAHVGLKWKRNRTAPAHGKRRPVSLHQEDRTLWHHASQRTIAG